MKKSNSALTMEGSCARIEIHKRVSSCLYKQSINKNKRKRWTMSLTQSEKSKFSYKKIELFSLSLHFVDVCNTSSQSPNDYRKSKARPTIFFFFFLWKIHDMYGFSKTTFYLYRALKTFLWRQRFWDKDFKCKQKW